MDTWQIVSALLAGFSLAAACGLRAFLPILIIGVFARAGMIHLAPGFDWIQSYPALLCFGAATLIELLGDKFPAVDHLLDSAGTFVRPIAGALAATSLIQGFDPLMNMVIGIILGSTTAGAVHVGKSSLRLASSLTTGGIGNPLLSTLEDAFSTVAGIVGLILPLLAALLIIFSLVFFLGMAVGYFKKKEKQKPTFTLPLSE